MIKIWLAILSVFILFVPLLWAADILVPSYESLQFSIQGLKDSAHQIKNKNQWLENDILHLESEIQDLRRQIPSKIEREINEQNSQNDLARKKKEAVSFNKKILKLNKDLGELESQSDQSLQKMNLRDQTAQEMQQKIKALEREIQKRQMKLRAIDKPVYDKQTPYNKIQLMEIKRDRQLRAKEFERMYQAQVKKQGAALKLLNTLKEEYQRLKEESISIQNELGQMDKTLIERGERLAQYQKDQEIQVPQLTEDIQKLKFRQDELEKTLMVAKRKLSQKEVNLRGYDPERQELLKNLNVLRQENTTLKDQYLTLQKTFELLGKPVD